MNSLTRTRKSLSASVPTWYFGLPAFMSEGFRTCPNAGICAKGCYAQGGAALVAYSLEEVIDALEREAA